MQSTRQRASTPIRSMAADAPLGERKPGDSINLGAGMVERGFHEERAVGNVRRKIGKWKDRRREEGQKSPHGEQKECHAEQAIALEGSKDARAWDQALPP